VSGKIGFIPTMGGLHLGHLSLVKKSIQECNHTVVSLFVNNKQFSPDEDFKKYPRDVERDSAALKALSVDVLFLPDGDEIYPKGFSTYVEETRLALGLEGVSRPHFFKGVLTVVLKLFNIVQPDVVYFGKKDIQQLKLVQKMVQDLNLQIKVVPVSTVREEGGLAMSSRNKYLSQEDLSALGIIYSSLEGAQKSVQRGERKSSAIQRGIENALLGVSGIRIDYIEVSDYKTLKKIKTIDRDVIISLAVVLKGVRLIDNIEIKI